jgi:hypothetical protein
MFFNQVPFDDIEDALGFMDLLDAETMGNMTRSLPKAPARIMARNCTLNCSTSFRQKRMARSPS